MRILRWVFRVRKLDNIRNERIWWTTKVGEIANEVQERRLKWHGQVVDVDPCSTAVHFISRQSLLFYIFVHIVHHLHLLT